jgi:hypothetical protein
MCKAYILFFYGWFFSSLCYSQEVKIITEQPDAQIQFGIRKISEAGKHHRGNILSVTIIADSAKAVSAIKAHKLKPAGKFGDQCYAIRIAGEGQQKNIFVLSGESTGAMYGALDIAEAISCNTIHRLTEGDHSPYLARRGIKFNLPLDLRTPTYSDPGDAHQQNIPDVWDLDFWKEYFDQMAIHRYNVMTWWSLQPFPSMVKVPEFPETALNDVWRTKEKYDDSFSSMAIDFDRSYLFNNVEVVKKMTIDEKIAFWRKVMQLAADRGIDVYLFTWNMFTYGVTGKHGITRRQDNDTTIAWYRASVREMVRTYPLLRGIGITAGEGMDNKRTDEYANEKWLWKTYGEGIRDGLKGQPDRKFTLVHRFHWAALNEIQAEFKDLPCTLELSLKYAIAHMYSITDPPFVLPAMPLLSPKLQSWLTIRNDDIYSFRWANHDFARSFIRSIPGTEKIAGFYMGPDGYCWGRDYLNRLNKDTVKPLILQKQWYSFMLWGRLSYDPGLPDSIFLHHLSVRFPSVNTTELIKGWEAASMIFPWATRFVWGDIDLKWFPEGNLSHPSHKGFYTVKDYIEREPMQGSNIESILSWANNQLKGIKSDWLSPLNVADTLDRLSTIAMTSLLQLPKADHHSPDELNQLLSDIQAFSLIGSYYAQKIRAACVLALYENTRNISYRLAAVNFLSSAKRYWNEYADIYAVKNKPALYNRVGFVDMEKLKEKVQQDIDMVKEWKPGTHKFTITQRTEVPFKQ